MKPIKADYSNITYTADGCGDLPATLVETVDGPQIESVWELTDEEIEQILKDRKIYLYVCGRSMPPVLVSAESYITLS